MERKTFIEAFADLSEAFDHLVAATVKELRVHVWRYTILYALIVLAAVLVDRVLF